MLWSGSGYREFAVWRERYPGGLTELEEAFAHAMASLATRRRRRQRMAAMAALALALAIAAVFGALWRRSVLETRRAEASKLLALAQLGFGDDPTEALALATSSLELADTLEARTFAVRALWAGPPMSVLPAEFGCVRVPSFSPDGRWLAAAGHCEDVLVWPESGAAPIRLPGHTRSVRGSNVLWWSGSRHLVTRWTFDAGLRVWSIPEGRLERTFEPEEPTWWQVGAQQLFAEVGQEPPPGEPHPLRLIRWELPDGNAEDLGTVDFRGVGATSSVFDPGGERWIFTRGNTILARRLPLRDEDPGIVIGHHDNDATWSGVSSKEVWTVDSVTGERRCWSLDDPSPAPVAVIPPAPGDGRYLVRDLRGRWSDIYVGNSISSTPELWDLDGPSDARTVTLRHKVDWMLSGTMAIHPDGSWMATASENCSSLSFFPLTNSYPGALEMQRWLLGPQTVFAISPDGRWIAVPWGEGSRSLRLVPMVANGVDVPRELPTPVDRPLVSTVVFDPTGTFLVRAGLGTDMWLVPVDGSQPQQLEGFPNTLIMVAAFSPSGRLVAAAGGGASEETKVIRVWDLVSGAVQVFEFEPPRREGVQRPAATGEHDVYSLQFLDESTVVTDGVDGVRRWDLATGSFETIVPTAPGEDAWMFMSADRGTMLTFTGPSPVLGAGARGIVHDLRTGLSRGVDIDPECDGPWFALGPAGEILAQGCEDGSVRVGRIGSDASHLLLGHEARVRGIQFSPDGSRIASTSDDGTLRLWPMPDLSKPPLHTLPHDELIAKLHTLTNLRVVRDEESSTGWKIEVGPFPGWATVPQW